MTWIEMDERLDPRHSNAATLDCHRIRVTYFFYLYSAGAQSKTSSFSVHQMTDPATNNSTYGMMGRSLLKSWEIAL